MNGQFDGQRQAVPGRHPCLAARQTANFTSCESQIRTVTDDLAKFVTVLLNRLISEVRQPSTEQDQPLAAQAFNLGALSAAQVVRLTRALEFEVRYEPRHESEPDDTLLDMLQGAIEGLAGTDLVKAREVLLALKSDPEAPDGPPCGRNMAVLCAPGFAPYDYELARDTVLELTYGNRGADDLCYDALERMQRELPPEQLADFSQHAQRWEDNM